MSYTKVKTHRQWRI